MSYLKESFVLIFFDCVGLLFDMSGTALYQLLVSSEYIELMLGCSNEFHRLLLDVKLSFLLSEFVGEECC